MGIAEAVEEEVLALASMSMLSAVNEGADLPPPTAPLGSLLPLPSPEAPPTPPIFRVGYIASSQTRIKWHLVSATVS